MTPILEIVAKWIFELKYEEIPEKSLIAARYQVLNMIASVHAASDLQDTAAIERAILAMGHGNKKSTILATGNKAGPSQTAAINAAYSMAQDFDDIIWMGHTCHSSVFASLAVAEHENSSSKSFIMAVVIANEVAGRLAASSYLGPLNGQMTTYIHLIGAAAATAKLLNLNQTKTAHALAISLAQPNFALQPAFMKPSSKLLSASTPIQTGIEAAYLAREGITGATDILEDPRGFWKRFSYLPMMHMWEDLGIFWAIQTLTIKEFPGCHYFQTACSALVEVMARNSSKGAVNVSKIRVDTTKFAIEASHFGQHYGEGEISPVNMNFDIATTLAVLLSAGRLTSHEATSSWLSNNSEAIHSARKKIEVRHDPRLTAQVLASAGMVPAGRIALSKLGARDLLMLRQHYSKDYGSRLMTFSEFLKWLQIWLERFARGQAAEVPTPVDSSFPLCFPSRIQIDFEDGSCDVVQIDLPNGSFSTTHSESVLREKFIREVSRGLGKEKAKMGFSIGIILGSGSLEDFIESVIGH